MERFLRYFLPVYFVLYLAIAFVWRSFLVWKRTGINPVVFDKSDNAHDFIGRVFKLLFAVITATVFVYSTSRYLYQYLLPVFWLEQRALQVTGIVLLLMSLVWTAVAQAQMGESWRIGIDQQHNTALVQRGVFRLSRNPIFLGMMITLLGLFLTIPNTVTLLSFVLGVTLIQIQVRLEEEFLARIHGEEYKDYCRSVRRWL